MAEEPNQSTKELYPQHNQREGLEIELIIPKHTSNHQLEKRDTYNIELPKDNELNGQIKRDQIEQDIQKYLEMNILNPDWKFAARHGQATKPGIVDVDQEVEECICCLKQINKTAIPLGQNSKQLQFLGLGFPLWFTFMKYAFIICFLQILNYAAIDLYFAVNENRDFCINHIERVVHDQVIHCTSFMILLANININLTDVELVLRITSYSTLLFSLTYVRDIFTKTWKYYRQRSPTYGTFSVIMEHFPSKNDLHDHELPMGERIRRFFGDRYVFPDDPQVIDICLIGQLQDLLAMQAKKKKELHKLGSIRKKIKELRSQGKKEDGIDAIAEAEVERLKGERKATKDLVKALYGDIIQEKQRLKRHVANEDLNTYKAIISFLTEEDKINVLKTVIKPENLSKHFTDLGKQISISQSPQPGQINWENINVSEFTKKRRRVISWTLFFLMLMAITGIIYLIFRQLVHQVELAVDTTATAIIISYLIGIVLFNKFILAWIIHHLCDFQQHGTGSNYQISFMIKYSLGLFFTTALLTIIVEGAIHTNVYTQKFGIVEEQTIMFFFGSFLVPAIWAINPWYIWKWIQRKRYQDTPFITQQEANKVMQDVEYIMGKRYGQIMESLWFTFFYMSVIPLGSVLVCIEIALFYWIDKYNLLRKSSIIENVSANLCMTAFYLFEFVLIFKPAGQLMFDALVRSDWHVVSVIQLGIGVIYIVLPIDKIIEVFNHERFNLADITIEELKQKNFSSYELYNPLTKQQGLKKHIQKIEQSQANDILLVDPTHIIAAQPDQNRRDRKRATKHLYIRPHEQGKLKKTKKNNNRTKRKNTNASVAQTQTENPTESEY